MGCGSTASSRRLLRESAAGICGDFGAGFSAAGSSLTAARSS